MYIAWTQSEDNMKPIAIAAINSLPGQPTKQWKVIFDDGSDVITDTPSVWVPDTQPPEQGQTWIGK